MKAKSPVIHHIMEQLHIQPVGTGYIDLICPKEHIADFIDEMSRQNIPIKGFTWWCHVTEGHRPCGHGGPKNRYGEGWYSEIPADVLTFSCNEEVKKYLLSEYPKSKEYKECHVPAFWLEME